MSDRQRSVPDKEGVVNRLHDGSQRVDENQLRPKKVKYALTARAVTFEKKLMFDYRRMLGVLDSGAANRKRVVAVCCWLLSHPKLQNAKGKWKKISWQTRHTTLIKQGRGG